MHRRLSSHLSLRTVLAGAAVTSLALTSGFTGMHSPARRKAAVEGSGSSAAQIAQTRAKIKHMVFIILENHTFDSIFGRYPGANGATTATVAGKGVVPLTHGPPFGWHDVDHEWQDVRTEIDGGKMDGFARVRGADLYGDQETFWQYSQADIPNFWSYAQHFTLADHMFSSLTGPTFPNRLFTMAAQSGGFIGNPHFWQVGWGCDSGDQTMTQAMNAQGQVVEYRGAPCLTVPTLADSLERAHQSWTFYGAPRTDEGYLFTTADAFRSIRSTPLWGQRVKDERTFESDARAGRLPFFSWITPRYDVSMHPPFSVGAAEDWLVSKLTALMQGPDWKSTAVFVTWDTSGGFYDHVAPPKRDSTGFGLRVPLLIISPYAKQGYISHTLYSHASILKTAEEVAGLAPLTANDRDANDTLDSFDFSQPPNPVLVLKAHGAVPGPTLRQYVAYLRAALTETARYTLHLSMADITNRHATKTLAQIAMEQKVTPADLARAMGSDVTNLNTIMQDQNFITQRRSTALQREYAARIAALLQAPPGTAWGPLLGTDTDAALLPYPRPFSGQTNRSIALPVEGAQGLQRVPARDPS